MNALDGLVGAGAAMRAARDQLAQIQKAREALDTTPAGKGASMLCVTTTLGAYPTTSPAVFCVAPEDADCDDTEGSSVTYADDTSSTFFAVNLTSSVPPQGSRVVCHACGGRWVFSYFG